MAWIAVRFYIPGQDDPLVQPDIGLNTLINGPFDTQEDAQAFLDRQPEDDTLADQAPLYMNPPTDDIRQKEAQGAV